VPYWPAVETQTLKPAPSALENASGQPAFGTYRGTLEKISLDTLAGPYRLPLPLRLTKRKKWVYAFFADRERAVAVAVVDLGYGATAFVTAVDLATKKPIFDTTFLGAGAPLSTVGDCPGEGLDARFRSVSGSVHFSRTKGSSQYRIEVRAPWVAAPLLRRFSLDATIEAGAPDSPLTVISPITDGGVVNVTQKISALRARATLSYRGQSYELSGVGGLDYTQGYLSRRTAWRWAFAQGVLDDGRRIGLNLVEGFTDESPEANENALWLDERLVSLGKARFTFQRRDPLEPWAIRTLDGAIDLVFRPIYVHRESRDLKIVRSSFVQPIGTFEGTIKVAGQKINVTQLPGVTEDQDTVW
jgi:hypothetical protein